VHPTSFSSCKTIIEEDMGMELERGLELSWCTQQVFYSCKKQTKIEEDMGMELERGLELFFQKN
jgi:hypothetical protein